MDSSYHDYLPRASNESPLTWTRDIGHGSIAGEADACTANSNQSLIPPSFRVHNMQGMRTTRRYLSRSQPSPSGGRNPACWSSQMAVSLLRILPSIAILQGIASLIDILLPCPSASSSLSFQGSNPFLCPQQVGGGSK